MIRKATSHDFRPIALHLFYAMEDVVYEFIQCKNRIKAISFLEHFTAQHSNIYSYENCYVFEWNSQICAVANLYDGSELHLLRKPVENYIRLHINPDFWVEDETSKGEIYLDTFAVSPQYRGRGVGGRMLKFLIDEFVFNKGKVLGLWVEAHKENLFRWYKQMGFCYVEDKTLMGIPMYHLQISQDILRCRTSNL